MIGPVAVFVTFLFVAYQTIRRAYYYLCHHTQLDILLNTFHYCLDSVTNISSISISE